MARKELAQRTGAGYDKADVTPPTQPSRGGDHDVKRLLDAEMTGVERHEGIVGDFSSRAKSVARFGRRGDGVGVDPIANHFDFDGIQALDEQRGMHLLRDGDDAIVSIYQETLEQERRALDRPALDMADAKGGVHFEILHVQQRPRADQLGGDHRDGGGKQRWLDAHHHVWPKSKNAPSDHRRGGERERQRRQQAP